MAGAAGARDPRNDLQRLLALGFTTVFATAYPNVGEFVDLRKAANDDSAPLSRFFGAGRSSTVAGGHSSQPRFNSFMPTTTDQARANVREMNTLGVDAIKVIYSDQMGFQEGHYAIGPSKRGWFVFFDREWCVGKQRTESAIQVRKQRLRQDVEQSTLQ